MGEGKALEAERFFEETVQQKDSDDLSKHAQPVKIKGKMTILEFLKQVLGDAASSGEIRRVIQQGGVEVDKNKITDPKQEIEATTGVLVKFGKRKYFKVE